MAIVKPFCMQRLHYKNSPIVSFIWHSLVLVCQNESLQSWIVCRVCKSRCHIHFQARRLLSHFVLLACETKELTDLYPSSVTYVQVLVGLRWTNNFQTTIDLMLQSQKDKRKVKHFSFFFTFHWYMRKSLYIISLIQEKKKEDAFMYFPYTYLCISNSSVTKTKKNN